MSPVKTTVETLPISEITFPKITVCPPRNTFTDLNYDLMAIENVSLNIPIETENVTVEFEYDYLLGFEVPISGGVKTKLEGLREYASEVISDHLYMDDWMLIKEENRFYNWYNGFTKISYPKFLYSNRIEYTIDTSATSGVITTKDFGKKFNSNLLFDYFHKSEYKVNIIAPRNIEKNTKANITFNMKVKRFGINRVSFRIFDSLIVNGNHVKDGKSIKHYYYHLRPGASVSWILKIPQSGLSIEEIGRIKQMPGNKSY